MAYYVVLSFDDEAEAELYVTAIRDIRQLEDTPTRKKGTLGVEGVFKKPTIWCDPSTSQHKSGKFKYAFTKGKKYGWWVCANCGRPSKGWGTNMQGIVGQGVNLLAQLLEEEKDGGGLQVSDAGVRHSGDDTPEGVQVPQNEASVD